MKIFLHEAQCLINKNNCESSFSAMNAIKCLQESNFQRNPWRTAYASEPQLAHPQQQQRVISKGRCHVKEWTASNLACRTLFADHCSPTYHLENRNALGLVISQTKASLISLVL